MIAFILFFMLAGPLPAEEVKPVVADENQAAVDWDFLSFLGMEPEAVIETLGPPERIYPFRGSEDWQDNVIFFYSRRIYLFWYNNRVWQVRLDGEYTGSVFDFQMGDGKDKVIETLGEPYVSDDRSLIYYLPDQGYPVKMRLFFQENVLSDFYLYRGDF